VTTVTIAALVSPESKEAASVAEHFWRLYNQSKDAWTLEARYDAGKV
jgi:hypothetical protein